ncbi:hypothetical protein Peur_053930 [Populus x canadensis]
MSLELEVPGQPWKPTEYKWAELESSAKTINMGLDDFLTFQIRFLVVPPVILPMPDPKHRTNLIFSVLDTLASNPGQGGWDSGMRESLAPWKGGNSVQVPFEKLVGCIEQAEKVGAL